MCDAEGVEIGRGLGFVEDREAVEYHMTPAEYRRWHHARQATPALAYCLMGIFDNDEVYEPAENESFDWGEEYDDWK